MITRRNFLRSSSGLLVAAPFVVQASSLMKTNAKIAGASPFSIQVDRNEGGFVFERILDSLFPTCPQINVIYTQLGGSATDPIQILTVDKESLRHSGYNVYNRNNKLIATFDQIKG